ncbi:MAG TPA: hypothetical protein VNX29_01955 [Kaistia sp.]|nr:hypothetical protein [Kaistia sp.]
MLRFLILGIFILLPGYASAQWSADVDDGGASLIAIGDGEALAVQCRADPTYPVVLMLIPEHTVFFESGSLTTALIRIDRRSEHRVHMSALNTKSHTALMVRLSTNNVAKLIYADLAQLQNELVFSIDGASEQHISADGFAGAFSKWRRVCAPALHESGIDAQD